MLLIDDLRSNETFAKYLGDHAIAALSRRLDEAMVFVFDDDVTKLADNVSSAKPSSMVSALSYARLPYETAWIETDARTRPSFNVNPVAEDRVSIARVGMLFESNDELTKGQLNQGIMHLFWKYDTVTEEMRQSGIQQAFPNSAAISVGFNFSESDPKDSILGALEKRGWAKLETIASPPLFKSKEENNAVNILISHFATMFNPYFGRVYKWIEEQTDPFQLAKKFAKSSYKDWEGEAVFFVACLLVLNTPRLVYTIDVSRDRINRKRLRLKKTPLYSHQTVRLNLGETLNAQQKSQAAEERRAHLVRGHFKIRRTGIFWWAPHVRGNIDLGFVDKDYDVGWSEETRA